MLGKQIYDMYRTIRIARYERLAKDRSLRLSMEKTT
jgi:hypothetical protein